MKRRMMAASAPALSASSASASASASRVGARARVRMRVGVGVGAPRFTSSSSSSSRSYSSSSSSTTSSSSTSSWSLSHVLVGAFSTAAIAYNVYTLGGSGAPKKIPASSSSSHDRTEPHRAAPSPPSPPSPTLPTTTTEQPSSPPATPRPHLPAHDPNAHIHHVHLGDDLYISPSSESEYKIFAGSGNPALAQEVAALLGTQLGRATIGKFADGETQIQVHDNIRGQHVYIIQPTCFPANDNLIELLLLITTLRRSSAERITAIVPYYSYARQVDMRASASTEQPPQTTIAGADVALMLESAGVDHVVAVDLHRAQVQGFFDSSIPVENLDTTKIALPYFMHKHQPLQRPVIVSPCGDSVKRAQKFRDSLEAVGVKEVSVGFMYVGGAEGYIDVDSVHHHPLQPAEETMHFVGDVRDRDAVIVDDMIDTGSRMISAAACLKRNGARRIYAYTTHGLFTGDSIKRLTASHIDEVVVFNTIPLSQEKWSPIIRQLSISGLLADTIRRLHTNRSVIELS